jgi:serine/threonine-protein kinase
VTRKIGSRYTVTRVIGQGTCGTVWEGDGPEGPVAIKLLREDLASDQTLVARFVQERTVLMSIVHPNVVRVRDLVVDGADLALVMDLVRGADLRERLDAQRVLRPAEAAAVAADVAVGLAAAHARGIVHRDVKPENVLLESASGLARLTDFDIARLVDGPRRTRATRMVGTPDYLAPEVIEGCPPGPPVDVYALGTLLFELLTGWTPFGGGHPGGVLRRHVTESVPEVPGLPEPLAAILASCLSKSPAARLTAAEVAGRLRVLEPALAGLPALRIADPRAVVDPESLAAGPGPAVPMTAGAVPLVLGTADPSDASRQTHQNLMRPIREPLGPSASVPRAVPHRGRTLGTNAREKPTSHAVRSSSAQASDIAAGPARGSSHRSRRVAGIPAAVVIVAAALAVIVGLLWWHGHRSTGGGQPARAAIGATLTAGLSTARLPNANSTSPIGMTVKPIGPFNLLAVGQVAAPPAKPLGAVHYVTAGGSAYVVTTGLDGAVRYATSDANTYSHFDAWRTIPGVTAEAEPAVVGRASGDVEIYVVSDGFVRRAVLAGRSWSPWSSLASAGTGSALVAGAPAAVPLSGGRTELVVASRAGSLLASSGAGSPDGAWQPWHYVRGAGSIKPDVALAIRSDGVMAAYVIRAADLADLRVIGNGRWSYAFPTGAVGHPEAVYATSGKPILVIRSVSGDVQVYEPSGEDLRGSMSWLPLGVVSRNPVGVTRIPGPGLVMTTVAEDGAVRLYTGAA